MCVFVEDNAKGNLKGLRHSGFYDANTVSAVTHKLLGLYSSDFLSENGSELVMVSSSCFREMIFENIYFQKISDS